jgi:hypothetical protein
MLDEVKSKLAMYIINHAYNFVWVLMVLLLALSIMSKSEPKKKHAKAIYLL